MRDRIILPDTNVILRYLLRDNADMYEKAFDFFENVRTAHKKAIILEGVLLETVYVLTKFYKVPKVEVAERLHSILCYRGIRNSNKDVLLKALDIFSRKNIDFVDCVLIAQTDDSLYDVFSFDQDVNKSLSMRK